jgi:hypothetical protein
MTAKQATKARYRKTRNNKQSLAKCYRRLIAAIVQQAIKDRATWFLERPEVKSYCAAVGFDTVKLMGRMA